MAKEEYYDRTDESGEYLEITFPHEKAKKVKKSLDEVPVDHDEEEDEISDLYGLDKDDCLDRTYPGVSEKE